MHLLELLAVGLDVDLHGLEEAGNARRRQQHVAEQRERFLVAARGDRAHVPEHATAGVFIGGRYQEATALLVLGRDRAEHVGRYAFFDQALERPAVQEAFGRGLVFEHVCGGDLGEVLAQVLILARTEECVGPDQGSDARSGHQREFRSIAGLGPAVQEAGPIGAVGASTGERQPRPIDRRQQALEFRLGIPPRACIRNTRNNSGGLILKHERRATLFLRLLLAFGRVLFRLCEGCASVERQNAQRWPSDRANNSDACGQARESAKRMHRVAPIISGKAMSTRSECYHIQAVAFDYASSSLQNCR